MVRTEMQRDFDVNHGVARQYALRDGLVNAFFNRRNVLARHGAAFDGINEHDALAGFVWLNLQDDVPEPAPPRRIEGLPNSSLPRPVR